MTGISRDQIRWIIISVAVLIGGGFLIYLLAQIKVTPEKSPPTEVIELTSSLPTRPVRLYFWHADQHQLMPETREIIVETDDLTAQAKQVLIELVRGPASDSLGATLPPTAEIKAVFLDANHCLYLDFNENFVNDHCRSATGELITIRSLIYTLQDAFQDVATIQILVEGKPIDRITGHLQLDRNVLYVVDWLY